MNDNGRFMSLVILVAFGLLVSCACGTTDPAGDLDAVDGDGGDGGRTYLDDPCGNGFDDDGDGRIDEGCFCVPGETQPCWTGTLRQRGVGACADGLQTCEGPGEWGMWGECQGAATPAEEACGPDETGDGIDDDCNGAPDDGCSCAEGETRSCGGEAPDLGVCSGGTQSCLDGTWSACEDAVWPELERCDDLDNDCDGVVDEGVCDCTPTEPTTEGGCHDGLDDDCDTRTDCFDPDCRGGLERCGDRLDNDCDGLTDEGCDCVPVPEVCGDRLDNDCDGLADEGCDCVPVPEVCGDGIDNDCDGLTDEGCDCVPRMEECNGVDDDCDDEVDEGLDSCLPRPLWSEGFSASGSGGIFGRFLAVDGAGNLYVTGSFWGAVNFGGSDLTSAGDADVYVASFTRTGTHRWSRSLGGTDTDLGYAIAVDRDGNVYVLGSFEGTVNFGGSDLSAVGRRDIFVASYTSTGMHRWARRGGGTGSDIGYAVAVDGIGNVYATGDVLETVNFGGSDLESMGSHDMFIVSYASAGAHRWSQRYGGPEAQVGNSITVDRDGNVYVTGNFAAGVANFGGANFRRDNIANGAFVASYTSTGVHRWSRIDEVGTSSGRAIAVDGAGNVFMAGTFQHMLNLGGSELRNDGNSGLVVASFQASTGMHRWSQGFSSTYHITVGYGTIAVDGAGNMYVAGDLSGGGRLGGSALPDGLFLASYASTGMHRWSRSFNVTGTTRVVGSVAVDDGARILYLSGQFSGTVNFGGGDLVADSVDAFVAAFAL